MPEFRDRADISAKRLQPPVFGIEKGQRNATVVLKDHGAMIEQENTRPTETAAVEEIGRALDETVRRTKSFAERQKTAARNGAIGEIGTKVIEGLPRSVFMRKDNPYSSGGATNGFLVRSSGADRFVKNLDISLFVKANRGHIVNGVAGACQKHIEDRQCPVDRPIG